MTCANCESDTADMAEIVVYGGIIFCNGKCLADYLMDASRWNFTDENIEAVVSKMKVVDQ